MEQGWEDSSSEKYDGKKTLQYRKSRLQKKQKTAVAEQDDRAGSQAIETSIPAADYDQGKFNKQRFTTNTEALVLSNKSQKRPCSSKMERVSEDKMVIVEKPADDTMSEHKFSM